MKILKLTAENVKKLRAVEITPQGDIVTIAGKNGQGKTSVLDSIWWALAGGAAIQKEPIRKGQTKARVRLDLGEIVVERRFSEGGSQLFVESKEGARYPSPQTMLDKLLGELSFDPLAFARMTPRDQFDELRRIAHLEVDIDNLDLLNQGDYAKRTDLNRDAKSKRAQAEAITVATGLPEDTVNENDILNRITSAAERNSLIEKHRAKREEAKEKIGLIAEDALRTRARAEQLRAEAQACDKEAADLDAKAESQRKAFEDQEPLPEPVDITAVRVELDAARSTNRLIVMREHRRDVEREAVALERQAQGITELMDERTKFKMDAISKAQMPVEGLGFGEGLVTYRAIPFEQCSSAEQLRVSLSIAMAANPKLRVIRIQDGSLLDEDSLAAIATMAKAGDYQVWIETVSDDGKVGIVIEDGMVKSTPESRAAETTA
jgi:ABC-type dipeptide/oligopeptide/nickel transport system ATPase component